MLAGKRAGFHDEFLVFAVNQFAHPLDEQAFRVAVEDGDPTPLPQENS